MINQLLHILLATTTIFSPIRAFQMFLLLCNLHKMLPVVDENLQSPMICHNLNCDQEKSDSGPEDQHDHLKSVRYSNQKLRPPQHAPYSFMSFVFVSQDGEYVSTFLLGYIKPTITTKVL